MWEHWAPALTTSLVQIVGFAFSGLFIMFRMGRSASAAATLMAANIAELQRDVTGLNGEVKKLTDVVIAQTRQSEQIQVMRERISRLERFWDELRRGEGWVLPLSRGAHEVPPRRED